MKSKQFATFAISTGLALAVGAVAIYKCANVPENSPVFSTGAHEASRSLTITADDVLGATNGNFVVGGLSWHISNATVTDGVINVNAGSLYNVTLAGATKTADNWVGSGFTGIVFNNYSVPGGAPAVHAKNGDSILRSYFPDAAASVSKVINFENAGGTVNRFEIAFGAAGGVNFSSLTVNYSCEEATPRVSLAADSDTIGVGKTASLTATPKYVEDKSPSYSYSSSDESVATVSGSGLAATVTGVAAGSARITVTMTVDATPYTGYVDITVTAETLYMGWDKTEGGPIYVQGAGMILAVDCTSAGYSSNDDANTNLANVNVTVTTKVVSSKVNFQKPGFAGANGLYITFGDADYSGISKITVTIPHKTSGLTYTAVAEVTFSGATPTITTLNGVAYATYMAS